MKGVRYVILGLLCNLLNLSYANNDLAGEQAFDSAYTFLSKMLEEKVNYNFKNAVYVTENAFLDNSLNYGTFNYQIQELVTLCNGFIKANSENFLYDYRDRNEMIRYAAAFKVMTDTVVTQETFLVKKHLPFTYDFEDFSGVKDWRKMFVSKLIATRKGNCHSLPFLYKILVEELGGQAHLALAPNHVYIKHRSEKVGMYNTELTSATFPIDGWLMASGYIHLDAVRSGIYMDKLSNKQSIALCLLDLAKGYQRKFAFRNDKFIMKCISKALEYYPNCINALLYKSEIMKTEMDNSSDDISKLLFKEYEMLIIHIYKLGYRKMPDQMYMSWLVDLKENKEKYLNKKVMNNFNNRNN